MKTRVFQIFLALLTPILFSFDAHPMGSKKPTPSYDVMVRTYMGQDYEARLAGVRVSIGGQTQVSDGAGNTFFHLKQGTYQIVIQADGFDPLISDISVDRNRTDESPDSSNSAFFFSMTDVNQPRFDVIIRIYDGNEWRDDKRLGGAQVTFAGETKTSDEFGFTLFHVKRGTYHVKVEAQYFSTYENDIQITQTRNQEDSNAPDGQIRLSLIRNTPVWASGEDLLHVQANFCNLKDSKGRVIFAPFVISLPENERAEWYARQRENGSTHTVLSPAVSYTGSPIPPRDLLGDPQEFRKMVLEALNTPSADGKGFRPILILDGGDRDPRPRIKKYWPPLIEAIRDLLPYVIVVPGWELIRASDWTSADLSYSLNLLHDLGVPHMWLHLSPGRASGSSNPVEADDPWQGAESGMWKSNGGQYLEGFLYQSEPLRDGDNPNCDPAQDACWLNRFEDVVPRIGNGMNGWRIVRLVLFENIAYYYYRNLASDALVRDMATAGKKMCDKYKVKCGFGNGLPR